MCIESCCKLSFILGLLCCTPLRVDFVAAQSHASRCRFFRNKAKPEKAGETQITLPAIEPLAASKRGFSDEPLVVQGKNTKRHRPVEVTSRIELLVEFNIALADFQRAQRNHGK
jgi:hypothetical protein